MRLFTILSYIFHPVIYPVMTLGLFVLISPYYMPRNFIEYSGYIVLVSSVLLPVLLLAVLKRTHIITSFQLPTAAERRYPFMLMIMIAVFTGRLFDKFADYREFSLYFFSGASGIFITYLFLLYGIKSSLHTLALGISTSFFLIISMEYRINILWLIGILFLLFGIIGYARYKLKAHDIVEIFSGWLIGLTVPWLIMLML